MKRKYILIAFLSLLLGFISCDMDKYPYDSIPSENAMENLNDCKGRRVALYSQLKGMFTGAYVLATEFQTDLYHATVGFSNNYGAMYTWSFQTSEEVCETQWFAYYGVIANTNYIIEGIEKLLQDATIADEDKDEMRVYYGEAHLIRAFCYYELAIKFCQDYEPETANTTMGVMLVTKYEPTSVSSKYPGRSNLAETYKRITDDIETASKYITLSGAPNSNYLSQDVIKAFAARVALTMHDWTTAINNATDLINSGTYPLISDGNKYANLWIKDEGSENIFLTAMGLNDLGNASGTRFIDDNGQGPKPDYVPEKWVIDLYDQANDIRFGAYFQQKEVVIEAVATDDLFLLYKYPGNPDLQKSNTSNYVNKGKPFRIAEMYLIAAEAYAEKGGSDAEASNILNDLKAKRIANWARQNYTGSSLKAEIRNERTRELIGEGFRLFDLKRWKMGVTRGEGQNPAMTFPGATHGSLSKEANDPRFLWPIPKAETDVNPQIKNQQNPGF